MKILLPLTMAALAACGRQVVPPTVLHSRLLRAIELRTEPRQVTFAPRSRRLAASTIGGEISFIDVDTGVTRRSVTHPGGATSVVFRGDEQLFATAGYDHTIRIWRTADGALLRTLPAHDGTVWSIDFSPDGTLLASGGEDRKVRLWRVSDGALLRTLSGHRLNVWCVRFSPDGATLGSSSFDHDIRLWRVRDGALLRTLRGHRQAVVAIAFSPDGRWLASGSDDSSIRLWRASDGRLARTLTGGTDHVYTVAFSPDSRWLATGGREKGPIGTLWKQITGAKRSRAHDPTIRLWRVSDGMLQQAIDAPADDVVSVAFSGDGGLLAAASEDDDVRLWRLTGDGS